MLTFMGFHALICSPDCKTYSRARHFPGPAKPLRDFFHQSGFPDLNDSDQQECIKGTVMAEFAIRMCYNISKAGGIFLFEHPEWLGAIPAAKDRNQTRSVPSSIFFNPLAQSLARKTGALEGAIHQCNFGAHYQKPTRILTTFWTMKESGLFVQGSIKISQGHA